jgi:hypothetical protein
MSMEDYGRGYDEGYDAGYSLGEDRGRDDGYTLGYNDCMMERRENWVNHELRILLRVMEVFCETDEDRQEFDRLRREGAFHEDPPHLIKDLTGSE